MEALDRLKNPPVVGDETEELAELRRALAKAQRDKAIAKAKTADLVEAVYQAARDAVLLVGKPELLKAKRDKRTTPPEVALFHLTDWQGGKKTPSYDMTVMEERVGRFMDDAMKVVDIQRAHHPVREATIMFGGDLLEGISIFPGQAWQVEASLFAQVFRVAALVEKVVLFALEEFERVHVVFEPGNHGRLGTKHDGLPSGDNMDRIIGEIVRQKYAGTKRLTWEMTDDFFQKVVVGNYRAMLIHGDEVRGFGGNTPAYALVRKGNAWASGAIDFEFDAIYVGHYHQSMQLSLANGSQLYMTGSTESGNSYAAEFVAATSIPSQRLQFVDPEAGRVTGSHIIWLDR